jgi:hypothetical protein
MIQLTVGTRRISVNSSYIEIIAISSAIVSRITSVLESEKVLFQFLRGEKRESRFLQETGILKPVILTTCLRLLSDVLWDAAIRVIIKSYFY